MVDKTLNVVVLPAPLGPKMAKISPGFTSNESESTALTMPLFLSWKNLEIFSALTMDSLMN